MRSFASENVFKAVSDDEAILVKEGTVFVQATISTASRLVTCQR